MYDDDDGARMTDLRSYRVRDSWQLKLIYHKDCETYE